MQKNSGFLNHQISALASGRVANNIKECLNLLNWAKSSCQWSPLFATNTNLRKKQMLNC